MLDELSSSNRTTVIRSIRITGRKANSLCTVKHFKQSIILKEMFFDATVQNTLIVIVDF